MRYGRGRRGKNEMEGVSDSKWLRRDGARFYGMSRQWDKIIKQWPWKIGLCLRCILLGVHPSPCL